MHTTPESPPLPPMKRRYSRWADAFSEARSGAPQWHRVLSPLAKSSAQQMASDIRNAHKREKPRVAGIIPGERWDATWGEVDGKHYVWIVLTIGV